jgi:MtaA/CmuA family methyltransferase
VAVEEETVVAEQMSSRERIFAALTRSELPDRLPCVPLLMTRALREGGVGCDVAQVDAEASAAAKILATERFGGDVIIAGTDLFTPVENLGAELEYLPRAQPTLVGHPAPTKESFERVCEAYDRKGFDPEAGRLRTIRREIQIFIEHGWKSHHAIVTPVGGPITTAQLLTGSSTFLNYLTYDPEYARQIIALALDDVKNVCRMMHEAGVDGCNILEPFLSCDVLAPETFREFALPALKDLFAYLHDDLGAPAMLHICTLTEPIWSDIADSGCLNLNGDLYPGLDLAKRAIGDRISLMGSVSPYTTMVDGSPEEVAGEVRKLAVEAGQDGGFAVMPGCDIDWNVPEENLFALTRTAASITYPVDVAALGDLTHVHLPGHPLHRASRKGSGCGHRSAAAASPGIDDHTPASPGIDDHTPAREVLDRLIDAVLEYDGDKALSWARAGLELGMSAQTILLDGLCEGMRIEGQLYERNERFVSDMVKASRTIDQALGLLTPLLESSGESEGPTGTVVMGLVRGNTQDIGKNLVSLMLRAHGFTVHDLGKNVRPEQFLKAAGETGAVAIGMSVMTNSSAVYVEKTAALVREQGKQDAYFLMMGGAAATPALARKFGVAYGRDAGEAVTLVRRHLAAARAS